MVQADGCSENRLAHLQNLHPADDLPAFSPCPWGQASKESFPSRKNVLLLDVEPRFRNCAHSQASYAKEIMRTPE